MSKQPEIYGLLAEFEDAHSLVEAARLTRQAGYRKIDGYSPFPIEELTEAMAIRSTKLPLLVFLGGLLGGIGAYALQYYASVIAYPLNVGGKPDHSWPSFIPVTFEVTILIAALAAILGMFALNGLPQPYHPCFHIERFALATRDRFFLSVEAGDPQFDLEKTKEFLEKLGAYQVYEVPQ